MAKKKQTKAKKFIGVFLSDDFHNKLQYLREVLDQPISSLVREGLNTLFLTRYKEIIDEMPEKK